MIVFAMPYMPSRWRGPASVSCNRPMIAPVMQPLAGLRRATAKKITTIIGKSMTGRKRTSTGMNAWMKSATSGMKMVAGQPNS